MADPGPTAVSMPLETFKLADADASIQLAYTKAKKVWDLTGNKGAGVKVLVIDGGYDNTHYDMPFIDAAHTILANGSVSLTPQIDHGTEVASIISGKDDGIGMVGIAPQAELYFAPLFGPGPEPTKQELADRMAAAIQAGLDSNIQVIVTSTVIRPELDVSFAGLQTAINNVNNAGGVFIAAVGQAGICDYGGVTTQSCPPATLAGTVGVGGVFSNGSVYANYYDAIDIVSLATPCGAWVGVGDGDCGTTPVGNRPRLLGGTSFAGPAVAAGTALVMNANPSMTAQQAYARLASVATNSQTWYNVTQFGAGDLNIAAAILPRVRVVPTGNGTGTITSTSANGDLINCTYNGSSSSGTCETYLAPGTSIQVTMNPGSGVTANWNSSPCSGSSPCSFTPAWSTSGAVLNLSFTVPARLVSIAAGAGTGLGRVSATSTTLNCYLPSNVTPATCQYSLLASQGLTLLTTPDLGYKFSAWGGACSGSATTCVLPASASNQSVTGAFVVKNPTNFDDVACSTKNNSKRVRWSWDTTGYPAGTTVDVVSNTSGNVAGATAVWTNLPYTTTPNWTPYYSATGGRWFWIKAKVNGVYSAWTAGGFVDMTSAC